MVESFIEILKKDDNLCRSFMEQSLREDNGNYLMELLLECTDLTARMNVATLMKYILNRLKVLEKDILYETETFSYEQKDEKTGEPIKIIRTQPAALCARFILKGFGLLNTYVAKNWSRFDNYLDVLYSFAVGDSEKISAADRTEEQ